MGYNTISTNKFYEFERIKNSGKICLNKTYCNDKITRTLQWKCFVASIYPSDYGFATSGGDTVDRDKCLNMPLYTWDLNNNIDCKKSDWMYKANTYQWALSPLPYKTDACSVLFILKLIQVVKMMHIVRMQ